MTADEMKAFVRSHFEEFINRKNLAIADVNFANNFIDHGTDVPPGAPPGPEGAKQYVGSTLRKYPDMRVTIEDIMAEGDKVVVRNTWRFTRPDNGARFSFGGIVIWRIAQRKLAERWAYLETPKSAQA